MRGGGNPLQLTECQIRSTEAEESADTSPIIQEVGDFLAMWACIEAGFQALPTAEQEACREDPDLVPAVFQGFDGNSEGEYLGAARFMIRHLACFSRFAGRDLESYHPVVPHYRRILQALDPVRERIEGERTLTLGELRTVLAHRG